MVILRAEEGAKVDAFVRAEVVEDVAIEEGADGLVRALVVVPVVIARAGDGVAGREEVDLALGVFKAEETAGDDGDQVRLVVDAHKVGHLLVEEGDKVLVADAGGTVGDALDVDIGREVEREEERVQLGECASQGMSDLQSGKWARQFSCCFCV